MTSALMNSPFQVSHPLTGEHGYIVRSCDDEFFNKVNQGCLIAILAPPQSGKTSLIWRQIPRLEEQGITNFYIDLKGIGDRINRERYVSDTLRITRVRDGSFLDTIRDPSHLRSWRGLFDFLEVELRLAGQERGVVHIDELSELIKSRGLYEDLLDTLFVRYQSGPPRLGVVLAGIDIDAFLSTTLGRRVIPSHTPIQVQDFTLAEMYQFENYLNIYQLSGKDVYEKIHELTDGHPSLTQHLLDALWRTGEFHEDGIGRDYDEFFANWASDFIIQPDSFYPLRWIQEQISDAHKVRQYTGDLCPISKERMVACYQSVLLKEPIPFDADDYNQRALLTAGLLKLGTDSTAGSAGQTVLRMRNRLFKDAFKDNPFPFLFAVQEVVK